MPEVVGHAADDPWWRTDRTGRDGAIGGIVHAGFLVGEKQLIAVFGRLGHP